MTTPIPVSNTRARRIAIRAQMLDGSCKDLLDLVRRLGFLQMDPIATIARPQHLVPYSRLGSFDVAELDRLIWQERRLFEDRAGISSKRTHASAATSCVSSNSTGHCCRAS